MDAAEQPRAKCQLYVILARAASTAVVFRRGPTKQVRLIQWDRHDDSFTRGQWFKGRSYERRGDLSPNGRRLVYFASNGKDTWTAISNPPVLTALALWPSDGTYGGGGLFTSNDDVLINHSPDRMTPEPSKGQRRRDEHHDARQPQRLPQEHRDARRFAAASIRKYSSQPGRIAGLRRFVRGSISNKGSLSHVHPEYMHRVALMVALALVGCQRDPGLGSTTPQEALGQATCKVKGSSTRPLLVEWPAADRAMLEAAAESGVVAARYDGCALDVLYRCNLGGQYAYRPLTHKRDEIRIRDADALWAELPLGAAELEGTLSREGQINVDMTVVGRLETDPDAVKGSRDAACSGATHVVSGMTVGAFAMYTGAAVEGSASASAGGFGGGLSSSRSRGVLRKDGDFEACSEVSMSEGVPPTQCAALLRVELVPLGADGTATSDAEQNQADRARDLERAADRWHATRTGAVVAAGVSGAGALAGIVVVVMRSVQIGDAEQDLRGEERDATDFSPLGSSSSRARAAQNVEQLEAQITGWERERRIAGGVTIGLVLGTAAFAGLAYAAKGRESRLRTRARFERISFAPAVGPGLGGLSVRGRF